MSTSTIVKSYSDKTPRQIEDLPKSAIIPWEKFKIFIQALADVRENERLEGIIITDTGIEAKVSRYKILIDK